MGLFDLVREEQEAKKKAEESAKEDVKDTVVKEVKKVEEAPKEADQQPAPVAKAEKQATEVAEESKKEETPAGKKSTKKAEKTYKYPFGIYSEGRLIDISSYGFVDGQDYTEKEITDIMLQHRHYEFAGTMEYSYIEDDNVLVVTGKQHRKG
jgi:hypothetical protein